MQDSKPAGAEKERKFAPQLSETEDGEELALPDDCAEPEVFDDGGALGFSDDCVDNAEDGGVWLWEDAEKDSDEDESFKNEEKSKNGSELSDPCVEDDGESSCAKMTACEDRGWEGRRIVESDGWICGGYNRNAHTDRVQTSIRNAAVNSVNSRAETRMGLAMNCLSVKVVMQ